MKDYSEFVKKRIKELYDKGIDFGKPIKLLSFNSGLTESEIKNELINFNYLFFTEKQERNKEIRYALYFVYNKRKGRIFVITFREKIRLITIYPLGKTTLRKYFKKKFKKDGYV